MGITSEGVSRSISKSSSPARKSLCRCDRHPSPDRGAMPRPGIHVELAPHHLHSLSHADQAKSVVVRGVLLVKPESIITNHQFNFLGGSVKVNFEVPRATMLCGVLQGLL